MSHHHYAVLTSMPDSSDPSRAGIFDEREIVSGDGRGFIAWKDRTDRVFQHVFQTFTSAEWKILREFIDSLGGRAKAFYLPSWQRDFELVADADADDMTITVAGHWLSSNVTTNRPDSIGRRLLIVNQNGERTAVWARDINASGSDDVLTLEDPLPFELVAGKCVICICYLSRLASDTVDVQHISPGHGRTDMTFREIRHRRKTEERQPTLENDVIGNMEPAWEVYADDSEPVRDNFRHVSTKGPAVYGTAQTTNFVSAWTADLDPVTNVLTLDGPSSPFTSAAYNAASPARQIGLMFDSGSKEIVAWELAGQTTVAWWNGSAWSRLTFDGISPLCCNTFEISTTPSHAESTAAVFYLKADDATIYARIRSENFATERRFCKSPLAPIRLHTADEWSGRLRIYGMDAGHRRTRWTVSGWRAYGDMTIQYSWPGSQDNLNTGTELAGDYVGAAGFPNDSTYMSFTPGAVIADGPETVTVDLAQAWIDGAIKDEAVIRCYADWYPPAGGSGPATLTIQYNTVVVTRTIYPGDVTPAATKVGVIRVSPDGTFELL